MGPFDSLLREALLDCAIICLPVLAVAALVGTVIAVLQAATQVQEQTLTLLPKLVVVAIFIAAFGPFGLSMCEGLFHHALDQIPAILTAQS